MDFPEIEIGVVAVGMAIGWIQIDDFFQGAYGTQTVRLSETAAAFLKQCGNVVVGRLGGHDLAPWQEGCLQKYNSMTLLDLADQVQLFSVRRPVWRPWLLKPLKNQMKRSIALKKAYGNFSNGRRERTAAGINRRQ
jgi:hypothetical protein